MFICKYIYAYALGYINMTQLNITKTVSKINYLHSPRPKVVIIEFDGKKKKFKVQPLF